MCYKNLITDSAHLHLRPFMCNEHKQPLLIILCVMLGACSTAGLNTTSSTKKSTLVAQSHLPKTFDHLTTYPSEKIELPANILQLARIKRMRAELREGPGGQFKLLGHWLAKDREVIIFNRVGSWQKVVTIPDHHSGWIHHKALSNSYVNSKSIKIPVATLPLVFSVRAIHQVYLNPTMALAHTAIPKGKAFAAFQFSERRILVWISETNSAVWLRMQDAH